VIPIKASKSPWKNVLVNENAYLTICKASSKLEAALGYMSNIKLDTPYLTVARSVLMASRNRDRRQFMRVLQILGDCYFAQYEYKIALQFYNEALEYGDCPREWRVIAKSPFISSPIVSCMS
jgi:hypothetical protein